MAFGMSPFPLQFGSRGGGAPGSWLIPVDDGSYVSCHEVRESVYRAAATALGIGGPYAILCADGHVAFTNNLAEAAYRAACGGE